MQRNITRRNDDEGHITTSRHDIRHLPLSAANANKEQGWLQLSTPTTPATVAASANDDDTCRSSAANTNEERGWLQLSTPTTTPAATLAVNQTGGRAPILYLLYLLYFIIFYYIIFNLMKKTRHTRATGVGFQRVTLSRPVPVPAPPIPGYPHGFVNPCHALLTGY